VTFELKKDCMIVIFCIFLYFHTCNDDIDAESSDSTSKERYKTHYQIEKTNISGLRTNRSFFQSYVFIENSSFLKSYAFGDNLAYGSGGALYAQGSSVFISQSVFISNWGIVGGALSVNNGEILIDGTEYFSEERQTNFGAHFFNNTASQIAGSLYFARYGYLQFLTGIIDDPLTLNEVKIRGFIRYSTFYESKSIKYSGACAFVGIPELYLFNIRALNNSSSEFGGAVLFYHSYATIKDSIFQNNNCTSHQKWFVGGGAICFQGKSYSNGDNSPEGHEFVTERCCFGDNECFPRQKGLDIVFNGICFWKSIYDVFQNRELHAIHTINQKSKTMLYKGLTGTLFNRNKLESTCWNNSNTEDDGIFDDEIDPEDFFV